MRLKPIWPFERRTSLENPGVPLSSPQAWAILAGEVSTDSGVNLSEFTTMRIAAVWRCVELIAGTVAQCPLRAWRGVRGDSDRKAVEVQVFEEPNPQTTPYEFVETTVTHELLWGNGYWLPIGTNAGDGIAQLWTLNPWSVTPSRKPTSDKGVPGDKVYQINVGSGLQLGDDQVVHLPGIGYDGIRGLSRIAHARQSLGLSVAAEQFGARLFGSGSLMAGFLSTERSLSEDEAKTIKARWRDRITGLAKAHEVAVLDAGMKWTPIGIPPEDAQFLQTRQFAVEEVCRWFGVPPHLAMLVDKTTSWGAGISEQSLGLHRYTLSHYFERVQQRATQFLLPSGVYAEFDTSRLLRGDQVARYAAYGLAITYGWLSQNEVRAMEQLPRVDGLDDYATPPVDTPPVVPMGGKSPKGN